jgi:hypothetical protein
LGPQKEAGTRVGSVAPPDGQATTGLQGATGQIIGFDGFGRPIFAEGGDTGKTTYSGATSGAAGSWFGPPGAVTGDPSGGFDPNSLEGIDAQILALQGQIASAGQGGGAGPDYSAFFRSPGYQFRLAEGTRAIDRSAAARGRLMSGGTLRELTRYGQGLASSEFNTYANRLSDLAGIGSSVATAGGQLGATAAGQVGAGSNALAGTIQAGGTAQASGIVGSSNAMLQGIQGAIGQFGNAFQQQPNWGAIQQQAYEDVNNPAYAGTF